MREGRSATPEHEMLHSSVAFTMSPISIQGDKLDYKWEAPLQMGVSPCELVTETPVVAAGQTQLQGTIPVRG